MDLYVWWTLTFPKKIAKKCSSICPNIQYEHARYIPGKSLTFNLTYLFKLEIFLSNMYLLSSSIEIYYILFDLSKACIVISLNGNIVYGVFFF